VDAARVSFLDVSLAELIRFAYRVKLYQVSGPDWMAASRFDVVAKLPDGATPAQVPGMMQTLLAERFHLELHTSTKEMPVYALVAGQDGPKLKEAAPDDSTDGSASASAASGAGGRGSSAMQSDGPNGSTRMSAGPSGLHIEIRHMNIANLVDWLSRFTDKPVVDQTGLTGRYDLALEVSRDEMLSAARGAGVPVDAAPRRPDAATDPGSDSVFTSMRKVGLKLEPRRLPLTILVVDHLEKTPTEN
jgi:uncharacterized protein (TIGR03435 family)